MASPKKSVSYIGVGTHIVGDVSVSHELWIEGSVEGVIKGEDRASVFVAKTGEVRGEIRAPVVQVQGTVHGDIVAARSLALDKSARVVGDITYNAVEIEPGAVVTGVMRTRAARAKPLDETLEISRRQS